MRRISVESVEFVNHVMRSKRFIKLPVGAKSLFLSLVLLDTKYRRRSKENWEEIAKELGYSKYDLNILLSENFFIKRKGTDLYTLEDLNGISQS